MAAGDNLSTDILGGNQAEIDTIWYNPHGAAWRGAARSTYTAADFETVAAIISGKSNEEF